LRKGNKEAIIEDFILEIEKKAFLILVYFNINRVKHFGELKLRLNLPLKKIVSAIFVF